MSVITRRDFLGRIESAAAAGVFGLAGGMSAQTPGERPIQAAGVLVLNPATRVPVSLIIDDSTCLVNLNRFAMPQFDDAFGGHEQAYPRDWRMAGRNSRQLRAQVRRVVRRTRRQGQVQHRAVSRVRRTTGSRAARLDPAELADSIDLVRTLMMPNWDIHPEMVTHTRVIDPTTGHPYPDHSPQVHGELGLDDGPERGRDREPTSRYALRILKNVGLPCEGHHDARRLRQRRAAELAQATLQSVPRCLQGGDPSLLPASLSKGAESVAPRVEYAGGSRRRRSPVRRQHHRCTGDWTGGWDNTPPDGVDKFITADLQAGRMVDVIERGEPAHDRRTGPASTGTARSSDSRSSRKSFTACTRASTTCVG